MIRLVAAALLMLAVACVGAARQVPRFVVIEESFGIYSIVGRDTKFIQETTEVPCQLGVAFGVRMTLLLLDDAGGRISLGGEMRAPPVEGVRPEVKQIVPNPLEVPSGVVSAPFSAGYSLDRPEELVDGAYTIRFYDTRTDMLLYKRTFQVSNCP